MSEIESIAFARLKGIPYSKRKALLDRFETVEKLYSARDPEAQVICGRSDLKSAEIEWKKIEKSGAWILRLGAPDYPKLLSEIPDPPFLLTGIGELPKKEDAFLAFVGPRKPSSYGARIAKLLAVDLAEEGLTLVSGMARGIDAVAHEAALQKKQPTIAVMACGIDKVYPPEHAHLKSRIAKVGCVLTEYAFGENPRPEYFPQRNRIISGLCKGTVIVEAGEKSGARITARQAAEQSREVYAVPGPIDSPLSMTPNHLIAQGAKIVESSASILEDYFPDYARKKVSRQTEPRDLSQDAHRLLKALEIDLPVGVDEIVSLGNFTVNGVLKSLTELELKGLVAKRSDARYVRVLR
jgi:DNA processing protein